MNVYPGRSRSLLVPAGTLAAGLAALALYGPPHLAGPAATDRPAPVAAGLRAPATPATDRGGVSFEVVPATPTVGPTTPTVGPTTPPAPTASPTGGGLPVTGSDQDPGWLAIGGAALVLLGALLIAALLVFNRPAREPDAGA